MHPESVEYWQAEEAYWAGARALRDIEDEQRYVMLGHRWDSVICRRLVEQAIPELVAEVRRLRSVVNDMQQAIDQVGDDYDQSAPA